MRRTIGWLAALSLPILLLAGSASAQKKDKDPDKDLEKPSEKWVKAGALTAKVVAVYEDKRKLRVQVTIVVPKANPGAANQLQQAQLNYANAVRNRDRNGMISAQREMVQAQATMITYDRTTQDVEVQAQDEVVVRLATPRPDFDEKGKPKRLTKAELKDLKGEDPKMPGYKAEFSDVQVDQIVELTIVRKKGAPAPKPRPKMPKMPKGKDKDRDLDNDPGLLDDRTPQVSMIYIIAEPIAR